MMKETKQEERLVKRKKERKAKEQGITLVALVITIVIIIISLNTIIYLTHSVSKLIRHINQFTLHL